MYSTSLALFPKDAIVVVVCCILSGVASVSRPTEAAFFASPSAAAPLDNDLEKERSHRIRGLVHGIVLRKEKCIKADFLYFVKDD